jgi:hypothetical protein
VNGGIHYTAGTPNSVNGVMITAIFCRQARFDRVAANPHAIFQRQKNLTKVLHFFFTVA